LGFSPCGLIILEGFFITLIRFLSIKVTLFHLLNADSRINQNDSKTKVKLGWLVLILREPK